MQFCCRKENVQLNWKCKNGEDIGKNADLFCVGKIKMLQQQDEGNRFSIGFFGRFQTVKMEQNLCKGAKKKSKSLCDKDARGRKSLYFC